MKGITHFISGVAVASCFPHAMSAVYSTKGLMLPLGGLFGVLPDTLDFRFARYIWHYQKVVRFNEHELDPKPVAEAFAAAIDEAAQTGRLVTLRLDIIRLSSSWYRTYLIYVDEERKEVTAMIGPLKTMSQVMEKLEYMPPADWIRKSVRERGVEATFRDIFMKVPCLPDSWPEENLSYTAKFNADIINTYYSETEVAIFSGPDFGFQKDSNGKVRIDFIPWHRTWAHSLTVGILMGVLCFACLAGWSSLFAGDMKGFFNPAAVTAFFIATLAFWVHIFEDQTGHLGSVLLWPFQKVRSPGLGLTTAASPMSNIGTNWLALAVIIWNMNVYAAEPFFTMHWAKGIEGGFASWNYYLISLANYVTYFILVPYLLYGLTKKIMRWAFPDRYAPDSFEVAGFAGDQADS